MKKAFLPWLIIFGVVATLLLAAYWYEQKYGISGPFRSRHGHGGHVEEDEPVIVPTKPQS